MAPRNRESFDSLTAIEIMKRVAEQTFEGAGSARVPRASSGGAPEHSTITAYSLSGIGRGDKVGGRSFRRGAANHTPEAYPPRMPR